MLYSVTLCSLWRLATISLIKRKYCILLSRSLLQRVPMKFLREYISGNEYWLAVNVYKDVLLILSLRHQIVNSFSMALEITQSVGKGWLLVLFLGDCTAFYIRKIYTICPYSLACVIDSGCSITWNSIFHEEGRNGFLIFKVK